MTPPFPQNILSRIKQLARMCHLSQETNELPDEMESEVYELETNIFIEFVDHFISNDHFHNVSLEEASKGIPTNLILVVLGGIQDANLIVAQIQTRVDQASSSSSLGGVNVSIMTLEEIESY
jgi:uncharacterized protein (DUF2164 family)